MTVHQVPFIRLLLPLAAGIVIANATHNYSVAIAAFIASAVIYTYGAYKCSTELYNNRHIKGIAICILFIAVGAVCYNTSQNQPSSDTIELLEQKAIDARESLIGVYNKYINPNNTPVLQALTLGKKSELNRELRQQFAASGGAHILAVSGLHVGIIYLILTSLAGTLPYNRKTLIISHITIIAIMWIYAFICGLPASVVRSALMFSLISGAYIINRQLYTLNSVFASAFIMLIINPDYLFQIGFQLSYAAVISILLFVPKIQKIITFNNKILRWTWNVCAVSIAAEIGTLPLTLYYFHQMPSYSLLTNFIVIPLATIILYLAIFLLITNALPFVATFIAETLDLTLNGLQGAVSYISAWPYATANGIQIEPYMVFAYYLIVVLIWFRTKDAKKRLLKS